MLDRGGARLQRQRGGEGRWIAAVEGARPVSAMRGRRGAQPWVESAMSDARPTLCKGCSDGTCGKEQPWPR